MIKFSYPFKPKSNKSLIPGQFWGIKLSNGKYACGRVLQLPKKGDLSYGTRNFLVGLMDWVGDKPPNAESITGSKVLKEGNAHILTIHHSSFDSMIHGFRALELDHIEPSLFVEPFENPVITRGYRIMSLDGNQAQELAIKLGGKGLSTWGFLLIKAYAEDYFGNKNFVATGILSEEEFRKTFSTPMHKVNLVRIQMSLDVFNYIDHIPKSELESGLREPLKVSYLGYRSADNNFAHVLFPLNRLNGYLVIVVSLKEPKILGHKILEIAQGIKEYMT